MHLNAIEYEYVNVKTVPVKDSFNLKHCAKNFNIMH